MALKETTQNIRQLLSELSSNIEKSAKGNKAASQRVRTGTIKFAKIAKIFRKESVAEERGRSGRKVKIKKKKK